MRLRFLRFKTKKKKAKRKAGAQALEPWLKVPPSAEELRQLPAAVAAYHASHPTAPHLAITCRGRTDGAGAQALAIVSGWLCAEAAGCRYLHLPFSRMAHAVRSRSEWAAQWESFLNLGQGEASVPRDTRFVPVHELWHSPEAFLQTGTVIAATGYHLLEFQTPEALQHAGASLRRKYRARRKSHLPLHRGPDGALTVAVHIRRGDVTPDHPQRRFSYTEDSSILNTIEGIRSVLDGLGRKAEVHVYSEGPSEMFAAFAAADCRLHLDGSPFEAFHNLVMADILVQAKSSFSYMAGLISDAVVLHQRYVGFDGELFYHPAPGWIVRQDSGAFDLDSLRLKLAARPETSAWYQRLLRRRPGWRSSA